MQITCKRIFLAYKKPPIVLNINKLQTRNIAYG